MEKWDDNELERFFEAVHNNQKVHIKSLNAPYSIIARINACYLKVGKHNKNPKPLLASIIFFHSKQAYMAAAGMAPSGQMIECFGSAPGSLFFINF